MQRINPELLKPSRLTTLIKPRGLAPFTLGPVLQRSPKDKMAQAPAISTCFNKKDIVEAITDNFNKVIV